MSPPRPKSHRKPAAGRPPQRPTPGENVPQLRALQREHHNFQRLLDLFESQLALFHRGEDPDYALMRDIMRYLTQYPDRFHHPNEDLVFERLQRVEPAAGPFILQLMKEHEQLFAKGSELLALLEEVANDVLIARDTVESSAKAYVDGLRAHMDKEEGTLFPLAEQRLKRADWDAIATAIRRYEDPLFGAQVAPGYRAIFEQLSEDVQTLR